MLDERLNAALAVIAKVRATLVWAPGLQEQLAAAISEVDAVREQLLTGQRLVVPDHWRRQRHATAAEIDAGRIVSLDAERARRVQPGRARL